jgi:hypothetical protein
LREIAMPSISDIAGGRGVVVKVLRVGVDGTDREIYAAEYGEPPDGGTIPRLVGRLLTHPVKGLDNHAHLYETLITARGAIKAHCEVAEV